MIPESKWSGNLVNKSMLTFPPKECPNNEFLFLLLDFSNTFKEEMKEKTLSAIRGTVTSSEEGVWKESP